MDPTPLPPLGAFLDESLGRSAAAELAEVLEGYIDLLDRRLANTDPFADPYYFLALSDRRVEVLAVLLRLGG